MSCCEWCGEPLPEDTRRTKYHDWCAPEAKLAYSRNYMARLREDPVWWAMHCEREAARLRRKRGGVVA